MGLARKKEDLEREHEGRGRKVRGKGWEKSEKRSKGKRRGNGYGGKWGKIKGRYEKSA